MTGWSWGAGRRLSEDTGVVMGRQQSAVTGGLRLTSLGCCA